MKGRMGAGILVVEAGSDQERFGIRAGTSGDRAGSSRGQGLSAGGMCPGCKTEPTRLAAIEIPNSRP
jgi:hypothetical protein